MALTDGDKQWMTQTFAIKEDVEAMETELPSAFHSWTSPLETQVRGHATMLRVLDLEDEKTSTILEEVRKRLTELEGKNK